MTFETTLARALAATLNPPFTPAASVTLTGLDPNCSEGEWKIEKASGWAMDRSERRGLSFRHVRAAQHEVTWSFEDERDATEFKLLF